LSTPRDPGLFFVLSVAIVSALFRNRLAPLWLLAVGIGIGPLPALAQDIVRVPAQAVARSPAPDYVVGAPDVLMITVWKQLDLSGKFEIATDGTIAYPLLGRVPVAGKQVPAIEKELTAGLSDGFLRDPHVTVAVEAFRSQQVFVLGEVKTPGPVPLTGGMTLIEALIHAGSLADSLGGEVVVSRRPGGPSGRPVLPGSEGAIEVQRVDLRDLRAGRMAENIPLQNGDTVFVTRAETVFVEGQVGNPGVFVLEKGMTVLRLISLAGGATPVGAPNRARIRRIVDGQITNIRVKLTDLVQAGDTVIVPTRLI
jgi:polysaccharide biosynthesis/export protein